MLITPDLVIIGTDHRTGHVYAFEKKTGKVRWKYPAGLGVATKIIGKGSNIYFSTLEDKHVCLNLKTGKENWSFSTGHPINKNRPEWNFAPAVEKDTVFFGGLDGFVYAYHAGSGKLKWKKDLGERVSSQILITGNSLFAGTMNGRIFKISQKSGAVEKTFKVEGTTFGRMTLTGNSLVFYVNWMKEDSEILSVDLCLEHVLWKQKAPHGTAWYSAIPFLFGDALLFGTEHGEISAFRVKDGAKLWDYYLKDETIRSFGSSGNVFYVGTLKGNLYALSVLPFDEKLVFLKRFFL